MAKRILFHSSKSAAEEFVETAGAPYTLSAYKVVTSDGLWDRTPRDIRATRYSKHLKSAWSTSQSLAPSSKWDCFPRQRRNRFDPQPQCYIRAQAALEYITDTTGPLTSAGAFLAFKELPPSHRAGLYNGTLGALATFPSDWPEVEYVVENDFTANLSQPIHQPDNYNYATIQAALATHYSGGSISITTTGAADAQAMNPNWLTDRADQELVIAAFKYVREKWAAMNGITTGPKYSPGSNVTSGEQILDFQQENFTQLYHAAGTRRMGTPNDAMAVVDPKARVYGVQSLRVVDASVFPVLLLPHPQSTIHALAEKVADDNIKAR